LYKWNAALDLSYADPNNVPDNLLKLSVPVDFVYASGTMDFLDFSNPDDPFTKIASFTSLVGAIMLYMALGLWAFRLTSRILS